MTTNDTGTRITLGDMEAGFNKKTGKPFTPKEAVAIADGQKRMAEQWAQLQSSVATIDSQLQVVMAAPGKMLQAAMADLNKQLADAMRKAAEPLRLLFVAGDLYKALKANDGVTVARIMASPDFGAPLLRLMVHWAEMTDDERAADVAQKLAEAERQIEAKTQLIKNTNQRNAKKPRGKTLSGELAMPKAKLVFEEWNKDPSLFKNKAAFKREIMDKSYCLDISTAGKWLKDFADEFIKNDKLSEGLKVILK